jgi:hypothetical protein
VCVYLLVMFAVEQSGQRVAAAFVVKHHHPGPARTLAQPVREGVTDQRYLTNCAACEPQEGATCRQLPADGQLPFMPDLRAISPLCTWVTGRSGAARLTASPPQACNLSGLRS